MLSSNTCFATEQGRKYLDQLCRHFAHKIVVERHGDKADLRFSIGKARLDAGVKGLVIGAEADTPESLVEMKDVVERHLKRFAFREEVPSLVWTS